MKHSDIREAIDWLAQEYWEWGYALDQVRAHKAVPGLGTMASDEYWRVYFDPALDWDRDETRTIVMHETAGHILSDHAGRAKEIESGKSIILDSLGLAQMHGHKVNQMLWNIATDAWINAAIRKSAKWAKFPPAGDKAKRKGKYDKGECGGVFPEKIEITVGDKVFPFSFSEGMPPEYYYWQMWKTMESAIEQMQDQAGQAGGQQGQPQPGQGGGQPQQQPGQGQGQGQGQGDPQDGQGQSSGQGDGSGSVAGGNRSDTVNQGQDDADHGHGNCGSVCGGEKAPWEDDPDEDCMDEGERADVIAETERRIADVVRGDHVPAKDGSRGIGTESRPPMLMDEDKVVAKVNHKVLLDELQKTLYKHLTRTNRSWQIPHRRIDGLPGKKRWPKQAVLIGDISGSINSLAVKVEFEVFERLYGRGFDLRVIACDTKAHVVTDRKAVYSGGGTNLGAGLYLAAKEFPHAGLVIVITDGQTPWPDFNPCACPVYVFSWERKGPEWAESVAIPGLDEDNLERPKW